MIFELTQVALFCVGYMLILFGIAFITEQGWLPDRLLRHPVTYILSLGIVASAWEFYGLVDLAAQYGYGALAYYLGTGALFLFAPVALAPLAEIARRYQIRSLADLLVFRYHSHGVGSLATFCMALSVIPLLALQLQAVADTLSLLTANSESSLPLADTRFSHRELIALVYCLVLAVFTILFGSKREKHRGLITAMAFESLVKVIALSAVGLFSVFGVFGGLEGLDTWLTEHPQHVAQLYAPVRDTASHTLLLVFIATAVAMPHIFHMSVVENPGHNNLRTVSWAFPLFLLFMALPVFPILWAGHELNVPFPLQYFTLGVPMQAGQEWLSIIAFVGGLSAATGVQVAITLALATMVLNHWLLPMLRLDARWDIYRQLLWLRRLLILAIFVVGFLFFLLVHNRYSLTQLALMAFIEGLQFLPGIVAIAYWPKGNSRGFIAGLSAGTLIWALGLFIPALTGMTRLPVPGVGSLEVGLDQWHSVTFLTLIVNSLLFVLMSLFTKTSHEEAYSAELCTADEISHPVRNTLDVTSAGEFKSRLEPRLGAATANQEVDRALEELGLNRSERRPYALRRLRDRLEANLSGLVGITLAGEILDQYIPCKVPAGSRSADITLIESRFSSDSARLSGIAAELNNLRLYYRNTLQELPMAICSLGPDLEILTWNSAMEELTGIASDEVTGSHLNNLAEPWRTLISEFTQHHFQHTHRRAMIINNEPCWFNLHKATIEGPVEGSADGQVILIEDVTEVQQLESELLHTERLASVGRLAAGVAHEIGNPVTGIACLAQNIKADTGDPELLQDAQQILEQTERINRIVQSLVGFSHTGSHPAEQFERVNLQRAATEAINLLSLQKDKTRVHYQNRLDGHLEIEGDDQRIIQVFVNLLSNARDASPPRGEILIEGQEEEERILVSITDQGEGIDPDHLGKILEPFYTTKEPGAGTGLGLSMVYSIVTDHQGQMDIVSPADPDTGRGAKFILLFPRQMVNLSTTGEVPVVE